MRRRFLFILLLFIPICLSAQNVKISGNIKDTSGEPMIGVTVRVGVSTSKGTCSNEDGYYALEVPKGALVTFSMIGYESFSQKISKTQTLNVTLKQKNIEIKELVVVGYSSQERRDITGSVSSIAMKEDKWAISADQLLQGKAPGVFMSNSSGALGSANVLTIRGVSTILGDNNPLYVIDGVPIYGTDRENNLKSTTGGSIAAISMGGVQIGGGSLEYNTDLNNSFESNPLASLNPDDIESIEILKDAFATAIYGSRGAAGVVLITTKKGAKNKRNINISYSLSFDKPLGKVSVLNADDYSAVYSKYYAKSNFPSLYNTDWQDAVTRTAISNTVNAAVSGGSQETNYFVSMSFSNNESYIINNDMTRYSARANIDTKLFDNCRIGTNMSITKLDNNALSAGEIYKLALLKAPNLPIYDDDKNYYYGYAPNSVGYEDAYNPVASAYDNEEKSTNFRIIGNLFLEYKPFSWLSFKTELGTDISNTNTYIHKSKLPDDIDIPNNQATSSDNNNYRVVTNNTINFNKILHDHFIQGVFGQSYEISNEKYNSVAGYNFYSPELSGIDAAQSTRVISCGERKWALFSAFARLNYQYKQRYMAGFTYRIDGSSRYNKDNRYLSIPSFSLAWRLSEESFIKNNWHWISDAKLRGSIGWSSKDGNNSYYGCQATYTLSNINYGDKDYLKMSQPGNADLTWEKTITYDLGLDMSLWKDRLKVQLDYFYKKTTDMLFPSDLPIYTGYKTQNQNIADLENQGVELQIVSDNVRGKYFKWQSIFNISHNSNKLLKLNFTGEQLRQLNSNYKYYAEGKPLAQWYLYDWVGINPQNGNPQWRLSDGTITETPPAANTNTSTSNKKICGTATPTVYGGLTNSLSYKNFGLEFMFTFSAGGHMINSTRASLLTYATGKAYNLSTEIMNMWQIKGQQTDIPKLNNSSIVNNYDYTTSIATTRFLEKSDYLRLKNVEFSYKIPSDILKKSKLFSQIKLYVAATNLFTLTPYSGIDPEVSAFGSSAISSGYDYLTMPASRSFSVGVRFGL